MLTEVGEGLLVIRGHEFNMLRRNIVRTGGEGGGLSVTSLKIGGKLAWRKRNFWHSRGWVVKNQNITRNILNARSLINQIVRILKVV